MDGMAIKKRVHSFAELSVEHSGDIHQCSVNTALTNYTRVNQTHGIEQKRSDTITNSVTPSLRRQHEPVQVPNDPPSVVSLYDHIVHQRKCFFKVPNNSTGKAIVSELVTLLQTFVDSGSEAKEAMYGLIILISLYLSLSHGTPNSPPAETCK